MTRISTGGRTLAIVAGAAFVYGGLRIILGEALTDPSQWTTSVQLTVLTVFGTIAAGHLLNDARIAKHWLAALGFFVLFSAGTGLVVYNSVGRQAEASMMTESQVDAAAERRIAVKASLDRAERMLTEAQADLARECKTGKGKRCEGIQATIGVYEAAVRGHVADLAKIGPQRPVHAKSAEMAKMAALFGADEVRANAALILIEPFLNTLFFEIGAIVSIGFAFRRTAANSLKTLVGTDVAPVAEVRQTSALTEQDWHSLPSPEEFSGDLPEPPPAKRKKPTTRAKRKDDVIAKIRAHTLKHGAPPTFKVVKARHRLSNGSAHRYLKQALVS